MFNETRRQRVTSNTPIYSGKDFLHERMTLRRENCFHRLSWWLGRGGSLSPIFAFLKYEVVEFGKHPRRQYHQIMLILMTGTVDYVLPSLPSSIYSWKLLARIIWWEYTVQHLTNGSTLTFWPPSLSQHHFSALNIYSSHSRVTVNDFFMSSWIV